MRSTWENARSLVTTVLALVPVLAGCSVHKSTQCSSNAMPVTGRVTLFPLAQHAQPGGIALGPDGSIWFTEPNQSTIGTITPTGHMTLFAIPGATPYAITAGPDNALWFADGAGPRLGRITPAGTVSEFALPEDRLSGIGGVAAGSDGNVWYTDGQHVGRVTPQGSVTIFSFPPNLLPAPDNGAIMAGPDGNLWILDSPRSKLWRVTLGGSFSIVAVPAWPRSWCFTVGADHNLWVGNMHDLVALSASGDTIHDYQLPASNLPITITAGRDAALWFVEAVHSPGDTALDQVRIARMTMDGVLSEYPVPTDAALDPYAPLVGGIPGIVASGNGSIWFLDRDAIGRLN